MATVSSVTPIKTLLNPVIEQALSNTLPINQLLRRPIVEQATGWTRSTIYRNIKKHLFTKPICLGGGRVAWPQTEVAALNQARIAGKSDADIMALVIELESLRTSVNDSSANHPVANLANLANSANPTNSTLAQKTEPKSAWSAAIGGGQ